MKFNSDVIRARRLALGLTQAQLAERVGVVVSLVSHWEKGDRLPSLRVLPTLASALGLTIDALYGREPPSGTDDVAC